MGHRLLYAGLAAAVILVLLPVTRSLADNNPAPTVSWQRLVASMDTSMVNAGQTNGAVKAAIAHASTALDDAPSGQALASAADLGVLALVSRFSLNVPYPLTVESLSPGGAPHADFTQASTAVPGIMDVRHVDARVSSKQNPPEGHASTTLQGTTTDLIGASNMASTSDLVDDGQGHVKGDSVTTVAGLHIGPINVGTVKTTVHIESDGTPAGTKLTGATNVSDSSVAGIPVRIGLDGLTVLGNTIANPVASSLNGLIARTVAAAGVFQIRVSQPDLTVDSQGVHHLRVGGLQFQFTPPPSLSSVVNLAIPVSASVAATTADMLAIRDQTVIEGDSGFNPAGAVGSAAASSESTPTAGGGGSTASVDSPGGGQLAALSPLVAGVDSATPGSSGSSGRRSGSALKAAPGSFSVVDDPFAVGLFAVLAALGLVPFLFGARRRGEDTPSLFGEAGGILSPLLSGYASSHLRPEGGSR